MSYEYVSNRPVCHLFSIMPEREGWRRQERCATKYPEMDRQYGARISGRYGTRIKPTVRPPLLYS
jgi:hypothetical protein